MIRYLLDDLAPSEREAAERRYFLDDSFFEALAAVECELIRDYFCDDLSATLRRKFEAKYLTSEGLREKVDLARVLMRPSLPEPPTSEPPLAARQSLFDRILSGLKFGSNSLKLALVCSSLAVVVSSAWFGFEASRLHLDNERRRHLDRSDLAASFVLAPGLTRDGSENSAGRLLIKPETMLIHLRLDIDTHWDAKGYRAFVKREKDVVWSGDVGAAVSTPEGKAIDFEIPAPLFIDGGNYIINLQFLDPNEGYTLFESYSFGVVGR